MVNVFADEKIYTINKEVEEGEGKILEEEGNQD